MIAFAAVRPFLPYVAGAAIVIAAGVGIKWYGSSQYKAGQEACEAAHTLADLESFKQQAEKLSDVSTKLESGLEAMRDAKPKVIERYTRVEVAAPLPADCYRDPERVRETNNAISEANAIRKSIGSVPADTKR